jgi:hypothetical protein
MLHEQKAKWWHGQAGHRFDADDSVIHGVAAYVEKQAHLYDCLSQSCVAAWLPMLKGNDIAHDWKAH